jgi:1,4-dihydroxy-6-naphthoate synthase
MAEKILRIGHSPDPDDAFMFYGLASGKVKIPGYTIEHVMEDIQSLNERALRGELEVTAISAHAYPYVADKYLIMATGASMGEGYGPVLVSKKYSSLKELRGRVVATPGKLTTATLLFQIFTDDIDHLYISFDRIIDAVLSGHVAAGVIIHEGQLTYKEMGLRKILDFGELWRDETNGLPLPLGLDVVRRDLGEKFTRQISRALRDSIRYGYDHQGESIPYALQFGRGIDATIGSKFVKMYVNERTIDMGEEGRRALQLLFKKAYKRKLIAQLPEVVLY